MRAPLFLLLALAVHSQAQAPGEAEIRQAIERHLGRPYVWGASGIKGFDCSGFIWRVAQESGVYFKRTTARKLWFSTRPAGPLETGRFGNLLFFNDLKHVGIVNDGRSFYHAQSSKGTNLSELNRYWQSLAAGEHQLFAVSGK